MDKVTRVGIDLAKKVFHVTAVDADGAVLERKRLRRAGLQSFLACLSRDCAIAISTAEPVPHPRTGKKPQLQTGGSHTTSRR